MHCSPCRLPPHHTPPFCVQPPDLLTSEELKRFSKSSRNARAFTRSSIVAEYGAGGMALAGQYGEGALEYFSEWEGENGSTTQVRGRARE